MESSSPPKGLRLRDPALKSGKFGNGEGIAPRVLKKKSQLAKTRDGARFFPIRTFVPADWRPALIRERLSSPRGSWQKPQSSSFFHCKGCSEPVQDPSIELDYFESVPCQNGARDFASVPRSTVDKYGFFLQVLQLS